MLELVNKNTMISYLGWPVMQKSGINGEWLIIEDSNIDGDMKLKLLQSYNRVHTAHVLQPKKLLKVLNSMLFPKAKRILIKRGCKYQCRHSEGVIKTINKRNALSKGKVFDTLLFDIALELVQELDITDKITGHYQPEHGEYGAVRLLVNGSFIATVYCVSE